MIDIIKPLQNKFLENNILKSIKSSSQTNYPYSITTFIIYNNNLKNITVNCFNNENGLNVSIKNEEHENYKIVVDKTGDVLIDNRSAMFLTKINFDKFLPNFIDEIINIIYHYTQLALKEIYNETYATADQEINNIINNFISYLDLFDVCPIVQVVEKYTKSLVSENVAVNLKHIKLIKEIFDEKKLYLNAKQWDYIFDFYRNVFNKNKNSNIYMNYIVNLIQHYKLHLKAYINFEEILFRINMVIEDCELENIDYEDMSLLEYLDELWRL